MVCCVSPGTTPLERIVEHYKAGETPEQIVEAFDSLRLSDVYGDRVLSTTPSRSVVLRTGRHAEEMRRKDQASQPRTITRDAARTKGTHGEPSEMLRLAADAALTESLVAMLRREPTLDIVGFKTWG